MTQFLPRLRKFSMNGKPWFQVVCGYGKHFRVLANAAPREVALANLIGWSSRDLPECG